MPGGRRRGPLWRLPVVRSHALGELGPAFGIGAGCGVGLIGGTFHPYPEASSDLLRPPISLFMCRSRSTTRVKRLATSRSRV
jgi:hypothetical protein